MTTSPFSNAGSVNIENNSKFTTDSTYVQTDGIMLLDNGTLVSQQGSVDIRAGILQGDRSTVTGNVTNSGRVITGMSRGVLEIEGDFDQADEGSLELELGGLVPVGEFDQLVVLGTANLGGTISAEFVDLGNGYQPVVGDSFRVVDGATIDKFDQHDLPVLSSGLGWDVKIDSVTLQIVHVDYGDAPEDITVDNVLRRYPTLFLSDGARHAIAADNPFLGLVPPDINNDGQPSAGADGDDVDVALDDEDSDGPGGIIVPVGQPLTGIEIDHDGGTNGAFLNAWIDLNIDGDWDDEGEQFLTDEPVTAGASSTSLQNITVPSNATLGTSFVRIRISTQTGLTPRGLAADGEVEDYQVSIRILHPWQNPIWHLDVTPDNVITPVGDILRGINQLNNPTIIDGEGRLPIPPAPPDAPPPFYDVSGDDRLTPVADILPVINFLNRREPEGESGSGALSSTRLSIDFVNSRSPHSTSEAHQDDPADRPSNAAGDWSIPRLDVYYAAIDQNRLPHRPIHHEDQMGARQLADVLSDIAERWWRRPIDDSQ